MVNPALIKRLHALLCYNISHTSFASKSFAISSSVAMSHQIPHTFSPLPQAVPLVVVPMQIKSTTPQAAPVFAVPTHGGFIMSAAPAEMHVTNITVCNGCCAQREFYQASAPAPAALPALLCENCRSSTQRLSSSPSSSSARPTISYGQRSDDCSSSHSSHRSQREDTDAHERRRGQTYTTISSASHSQSDGWPETDVAASQPSGSFSSVYYRDCESERWHRCGGGHGYR